ncbi:aminopeptidase, partial [archaeon]|nr:aminopeptidase [archaeon]
MTLEKAAQQAVKVCLAIKPEEHVLIICDNKHLNIGKAIENAASYASTTLLILEDLGKRPLEMLPEQIKQEIDRAQAAFFIAESVPGELTALRKPLGLYAKQRCRYAHMPNVNEQVMIDGLSNDNRAIQEFTERVFTEINGKTKMEVTSEIGTDLTFTLKPNRKWLVFGSMLKENGWTNLPGAEVAVCPENVNGKAVIDGVIGDFFIKYGSIASSPLTLNLSNGRITSLECKNNTLASELRDYLHTDEESNRIGEVAFGTNLFLKKFIGKMILDEKYPTVHFAAGHPYISKGEPVPYDSKTHVDFVMRSVTAKVDGKTILE